MGKISTYQQRQLASSAVAPAPADTSGAILAQGVKNLGDALIKRQEALDTAAATKKYYEFVSADALQTADLQKKYMQNRDIDPLGFDQEYQQKAGTLAGTFKSQMPERLQEKFDLLVAGHLSKQTVSNTSWVMSQQNRNALEDFNESGVSFVEQAGTKLNAADYFELKSELAKNNEAFKPLVTASSYEKATKTFNKEVTLSHLYGRMDMENGGDPVKLAYDLETNEEYRNDLKATLGEKAFKTIEDGLDRDIRNLGIRKAYLKMEMDGQKVSDLFSKVVRQESGFGLASMQQELLKEQNYLASLKVNNTKGVNDAAIKQSEQTVDVLSNMTQIARYANDRTVTTDPTVKNGFLSDIQMVLSGLMDKDGKTFTKEGKKIAERAMADKQSLVSKASSSIESRALLGLAEIAFPELVSSTSIIEGETTAPKDASTYMKGIQIVKANIVKAVLDKKIRSEEGEALISKLMPALGTLNYYDKVQKGQDWYSAGYNSFRKYVAKMPASGTIEQRRASRDEIQAQMMDQLAVIAVDQYNGDIPVNLVPGIVKQITDDQSRRQNIGMYNALPGDIVEFKGKSVKFMGFDPISGMAQFETPEGLEKALMNQ